MTGNNTIAGFQLSAQQARIWSQQTDIGLTFSTECEIRIEGPLDVSRLREAFRQSVLRHEILRTVFQRQSGLKVPFQVILENPEFLWEATQDSKPGEFDLE